MSIVRVGFFIAISMTFCLTSVTYCHPNESGINRHKNQKLSRLLKQETLGDVYHSLEAFENDEESLPDNSQTPLKRSLLTKDSLKPNSNCNSEPNEKTKKEKKSELNKTSGPKNVSIGSDNQVNDSVGLRVDDSKKANPPPSDETCVSNLFTDTDKFFESVNTNLELLSNELSKVFNDLENKTMNLMSLTKFKNTDLFDANKYKLAKNSSNIVSFISELKQNFTKIIPTIGPISNVLAPLKSYDNISTRISTYVDNISKNVTDFVTRMKEKITGVNIFSTFLKQITDAVNSIKNFTIFNSGMEGNTKNNETKNQAFIDSQLMRQGAALGILGQFLNSLSQGISGFFEVISRKWSHEDSHHHGLFGSVKHALGWPSHAHREPNLFHKMFSFPNLHWKHHHEHVPLLKKVFKIPDHHHYHHHRPGSIIKHLLNSLYSVFHLSDHCECPQGSNSATSSSANRFFNWLGGTPTPHHNQHAPGHTNLHRNVMKHKQSACSCS